MGGRRGALRGGGAGRARPRGAAGAAGAGRGPCPAPALPHASPAHRDALGVALEPARARRGAAAAGGRAAWPRAALLALLARLLALVVGPPGQAPREAAAEIQAEHRGGLSRRVAQITARARGGRRRGLGA
jgi:hypothetical protein